MPTITSLGVGSGLDLNTMVSQLVALERKPLEQMRSQATRLQTQVSSYGQLKSLFSAVQDAATALNNGALWQRSLATSSNDSAVAAIGGSGAATGNYAVAVQALARGQTLVSGSSLGSPGSLAGTGTLRLQLGSWDGASTSFSPRSGSSEIAIEIGPEDTLANVRDKINAAGAGVQAALVTDANGTRLSLRSAETGQSNGFRVQVSDTGAGELSRLAYDPENGAGSMQLSIAAANARATVNGIAVESESNELDNVIDGLTLRLRRETGTEEVNVNLASDRQAVEAAVKSFVEAYNALSRFISNQTRYDEASKTAGSLQGDSSITAVQARLRAVLSSPSAAAAAFPRISDIGLQTQRDGTLKIDEAKLQSALNDLPELRRAFGNSDSSNPANEGFTRRLSNFARQVLDIEGALNTRTEGLQKMISKNSNDQERLELRVERFQARLVAQYTAMDANLARLNALGSYVTQQFSNNGLNGGNKP